MQQLQGTTAQHEREDLGRAAEVLVRKLSGKFPGADAEVHTTDDGREYAVFFDEDVDTTILERRDDGLWVFHCAQTGVVLRTAATLYQFVWGFVVDEVVETARALRIAYAERPVAILN